MIYYDVENAIDDIIEYLNNSTTGINAAITALNTQKSAQDTAAGRVVMALTKFQYDTGGVATDGLKEGQNLNFFMLEEACNYDPFMLVEIQDWVSDELGADTITLNFVIVTEDVADGTDPKRKLLRYARVLRATLLQFISGSALVNATKISDIAPDVAQTFIDGVSRSYYSVGVSVQIVCANTD